MLSGATVATARGLLLLLLPALTLPFTLGAAAAATEVAAEVVAAGAGPRGLEVDAAALVPPAAAVPAPVAYDPNPKALVSLALRMSEVMPISECAASWTSSGECCCC